MTGPQIIVLATPVFLALIGVELAIGRARGRAGYRLNDALSSIGLGVMSQVAGVFTAVLTLGIYVAVHERFAVWQLAPTSPWTWAIGLVAYDFLYYWHHRAGHRVALFWAAHVVHHQSEDYNLSTALRQTSSGWLVGWIFYLPMAIAGFPPLVFAVVALIDLLYQFWVHTEQVGRLGGFDRWFCAPSNHRVHHAVNDVYLDRNYGGVFLVWDRLFGTYAEEDPRGAVRLRHAGAAQELEPDPRQPAGLRRARPRFVARDALARQAARLAEAAGLAAGRRRGALAEGAVRGRRASSDSIRPRRRAGRRSRCPCSSPCSPRPWSSSGTRTPWAGRSERRSRSRSPSASMASAG